MCDSNAVDTLRLYNSVKKSKVPLYRLLDRRYILLPGVLLSLHITVSTAWMLHKQENPPKDALVWNHLDGRRSYLHSVNFRKFCVGFCKNVQTLG